MADLDDALEYREVIDAKYPFLLEKREVILTREDLPKHFENIPEEAFKRWVGIEKKRLRPYFSDERLWEEGVASYFEERSMLQSKGETETLGKLHEQIDQIYGHLVGWKAGPFGTIPIEKIKILSEQNMEIFCWKTVAGLVMWARKLKDGDVRRELKKEKVTETWASWANENADNEEYKDIVRFTRNILADWSDFTSSWSNPEHHYIEIAKRLSVESFGNLKDPVYLYDIASKDFKEWMRKDFMGQKNRLDAIKTAPKWLKKAFRHNLEEAIEELYGEGDWSSYFE